MNWDPYVMQVTQAATLPVRPQLKLPLSFSYCNVEYELWEQDYWIFFLILNGKYSFKTKYDIGCEFFIDSLYEFEDYILFLDCWLFSKTYGFDFCHFLFFLPSLEIINFLFNFLNSKPVLHSVINHLVGIENHLCYWIISGILT